MTRISVFQIPHHSVDDGGAHGGGPEDGCGVAALAHRPQLVLPPRVARVAVPRVTHHLQGNEDLSIQGDSYGRGIVFVDIKFTIPSQRTKRQNELFLRFG